jgi:hypothetical protein
MQAPAPGTGDPFGFFEPVRVSASERQRIDRGEAAVRILPGRDREVAVLAVAKISIDAERLIAWVHDIEALKKSALVPVIQRFSQPPVIADVARAQLPPDDLDDLRDCEPGDCGVKITAAELARLKPFIGPRQPAADDRLRQAFRDLMLDRIRTYVARGAPALGSYDDGSSPATLQAAFESLLARSPYITERLPHLAAHLRQAPSDSAGVDWFLYWSQDQVRSLPVLTATHVAIVRGQPPAPLALVAGRQIFATHYMNASLSVTALVAGPGGVRYLFYINRTNVDVVSGLFGPLARRIIEGRIRSEAVTAITDLRRRLESGPPPKAAARQPAEIR